MAMGKATAKADHNGAKNGGGAWCRRAVAKAHAKKFRRRDDRARIAEQRA